MAKERGRGKRAAKRRSQRRDGHFVHVLIAAWKPGAFQGCREEGTS